MIAEFNQPTSHLTTNQLNWNERLGHPSNKILKNLGLQSTENSCETCVKGKLTILPFKGHFDDVQKPLDCLHLDLVGPISPPLVSGHKYFLTVVDQFTSYRFTRFLKRKSNAIIEFIALKELIETSQESKIKKSLFDRGGEFLNKQFQHLSEKHGFVHVFSPAYTQHNVFAEQANRTILDKTCCLLLTENLPKSYWAEAVKTATNLRNMIPNPS
ncbi:hypothetical protein O181_096723 [Austropuccinia psidii MF-1]|uniref:Integrase catalytic domain-containing protein n=1 Tax=Austropuccinia psidii MF-1 TaxID=1389203 RepID=A0A9Q3J7I0_9BASI|nr:hypothetical protein [Austropuccinia psidii MF-1]